MNAVIKMIMEFLVKLMSLIGENVPGFLIEWMEKLETEGDETEDTTATA